VYEGRWESVCESRWSSVIGHRRLKKTIRSNCVASCFLILWVDAVLSIATFSIDVQKLFAFKSYISANIVDFLFLTGFIQNIL
jgi:hypothetical protein